MSNSGGSWPQDRLRRKVLWVEGGDRRERCVTWCLPELPSFLCLCGRSLSSHPLWPEYSLSGGHMGKPCWMWISH